MSNLEQRENRRRSIVANMVGWARQAQGKQGNEKERDLLGSS